MVHTHYHNLLGLGKGGYQQTDQENRYVSNFFFNWFLGADIGILPTGIVHVLKKQRAKWL